MFGQDFEGNVGRHQKRHRPDPGRDRAKAPTYQYTLPTDNDKVSTDGMVMGSLAVLRAFNNNEVLAAPSWIEAQARALCLQYRDTDANTTNDFDAFQTLFVSEYTAIYQFLRELYKSDHERYAQDHTCLEKLGPLPFVRAARVHYTALVTRLRLDQAKEREEAAKC